MTDIADVFAECRIAGIMDGISLCRDCHSKFDGRDGDNRLFINPVNKKVEISADLSKIPKYQQLIGKKISPISTSGHFPTPPSLKIKYDQEQKKMDQRHLKNAGKTAECDVCHEWFKNDKGVAVHQRKRGCLTQLTKRKGQVVDQCTCSSSSSSSSSASVYSRYQYCKEQGTN
jgi:hypothetical protein